ncbi:hypothetical protein V5J35_000902 [Endozoicomonas sp. NE40]|uniref:Uncharacterized protein n=1 Tax=Endozoicomonas lisbonensis TaxID=3120522 RepID=A0ABV2SD72_9GAMM
MHIRVAIIVRQYAADISPEKTQWEFNIMGMPTFDSSQKALDQLILIFFQMLFRLFKIERVINIFTFS